MINKFFKIIHNKHSKLFKFVFFLRYLFIIFLISFALYLSIPNFLNYEKKVKIINNYLIENYNFKIDKYERIEFRSLPSPRLELKNASIYLTSKSKKLEVNKLKIPLKFLGIYNYKNLQVKKIIFEDSRIFLKTSELKFFFGYLFGLQNKLFLDNLDINIQEENKLILKINNFRFTNFGYDKNLIRGEVFGKKFDVLINDDFNNIKFKFPNSGLNTDLNFDINEKSNLIIGDVKSKILTTNIKFNFDINKKILNINNLYFRNKKLSFYNRSKIIFSPYLDISSRFEINEIKTELFKKLDIYKVLSAKDFIKKINSKNIINYKSKKPSKNLIDEVNLEIDLAYGRINYLNKIFISNSIFECKGNINLLDEFPLLFFDCTIYFNDDKKLFKKFSLNKIYNNKNLKLYFTGNLNILNKKINFGEILFNDNYRATKEDLKYFKNTFENKLLDESLSEIFNIKKIENFILEIS